MRIQRDVNPNTANSQIPLDFWTAKNVRDFKLSEEATHRIISTLKAVADNCQRSWRREIIGLTERIKLCNSRNNSWSAEDAINFETGELFEARGKFWRCWSKLCPTCTREMARRSRSKLRKAIEVQKVQPKERFYFATFTIPNPKLSLIETREIVNYAWSIFRKRKLFRSLIRGGCKTEEFTITANGIHYHLHTILLSKFIWYKAIRALWTECVEVAFQRASIPFKVNTSDGMLQVNLQPVKINEGLIQEVCKYVTKSDSWQKLNLKDVFEVATIARWHRMFELFGSFGQVKLRKSLAPDEIAKRETIVHTEHLSDGEPSPSHANWRHEVNCMTEEAFRLKLESELERSAVICVNRIRRKWPGCKVESELLRKLNEERRLSRSFTDFVLLPRR